MLSFYTEIKLAVDYRIQLSDAAVFKCLETLNCVCAYTAIVKRLSLTAYANLTGMYVSDTPEMKQNMIVY